LVLIGRLALNLVVEIFAFEDEDKESRIYNLLRDVLGAVVLVSLCNGGRLSVQKVDHPAHKTNERRDDVEDLDDHGPPLNFEVHSL